jgi:hypothetical protein
MQIHPVQLRFVYEAGTLGGAEIPMQLGEIVALCISARSLAICHVVFAKQFSETGSARTFEAVGSNIRRGFELVAEKMQDNRDPRIDRMWCVHLVELPSQHEGYSQPNAMSPKNCT